MWQFENSVIRQSAELCEFFAVIVKFYGFLIPKSQGNKAGSAKTLSQTP